jgi:hypothetical protein
MAAVYCRLCQFDHPRPVGSNCNMYISDLLSRRGNVNYWDSRYWRDTGDHSCIDGHKPVVGSAGERTSHSRQLTQRAAECQPARWGIRLPTSEPAPLQREDVLNRTTQSEAPSRGSRCSNRSRLSVSDKVLAELRSMLRYRGLIYQSQQEDRLRMSHIEERLNVSTVVNTSVGYSITPKIAQSYNYIYCTTQAGPTYTVASSRPISHSAVIHSAFVTAYAPPPHQYQLQPVYNGQSLREVRADPMVSAAVKQQCHMLVFTHRYINC